MERKRRGHLLLGRVKVLFYSEKQYADEDPDGEYGEHTRCTFYGIESSDFDVADENEILSLLGV